MIFDDNNFFTELKGSSFSINIRETHKLIFPWSRSKPFNQNLNRSNDSINILDNSFAMVYKYPRKKYIFPGLNPSHVRHHHQRKSIITSLYFYIFIPYLYRIYQLDRWWPKCVQSISFQSAERKIINWRWPISQFSSLTHKSRCMCRRISSQIGASHIKSTHKCGSHF